MLAYHGLTVDEKEKFLVPTWHIVEVKEGLKSYIPIQRTKDAYPNTIYRPIIIECAADYWYVYEPEKIQIRRSKSDLLVPAMAHLHGRYGWLIFPELDLFVYFAPWGEYYQFKGRVEAHKWRRKENKYGKRGFVPPLPI